MSAADEDTELRDLLVQTLDKNGILGKIKAELRASIFLALEAQEQSKAQNPLRNTKLQKLVANDDGKTCIAIVKDFLEHFNLDFTAAVFVPEANVNDSIPSSDEVRQRLQIVTEQKGLPLLAEILRSSQPADKLASHQVRFLRSKFDSFDRHGSGTIDRKDVTAVISLACPLFGPEMLERFVTDELQGQYSSSVTFDVFIGVFRRLHQMCESITSVGMRTGSPAIPPTQTLVKSPDKPTPTDSYFMKQSQAFHQVPASPTPLSGSQSKADVDSEAGVPPNYLMPPSAAEPQDGSMDVAYDDFFDDKPERKQARSGDGFSSSNQMSSLANAPAIAPGSASRTMTAGDWPNKKQKMEYSSGSHGYDDDFTSEQSISEEIPEMVDDLLQSSDKEGSLDLTEDRTVSEIPHADYMEDIRHG